ncbi:substrate-binding domain-containing protein [Clavibacter michiganensis]|nr:substrate-binding domain-containing protein [Clavibacter michiganensis]MDO4018833.1 substrate-binding domain-containing protein [Clavibacter michiganensis]
MPAELSVAGIDGHALAPLFGLTTVEQHPRLQGRTAVGMVFEGLAAEGALERTVTVPVDFQARTSTTAPPAPPAP